MYTYVIWLPTEILSIEVVFVRVDETLPQEGADVLKQVPVAHRKLGQHLKLM